MSNEIFGNRVSRFAAWKAGLAYKLCKKIFGEQKEPLDLVAVAKGEVYKDFKVLTLVRREDLDAQKDDDGKQLKVHEIDPNNALVIGTIRMGFGHWRIAIALASVAASMNVRAYILDFLSFTNTPIARSIKFLEGLYNTFSRLSQKSKWFNNHIWEDVTSRANATLDSAIQNREISRLFMGAFKNLPKNIPLVAAHPWVGWSALHCGMTNVVSMVPDNLPLAFWLVQGSLHTVQSPSAYMGYRALLKMERGCPIKKCLPASDIIQTGHYVDYELLRSIKSDCKARLDRAKRGEARRFLLTMGGAGAQAHKFGDIAGYCKEYIKQEKCALLINMGDHEGRWFVLKELLEAAGVPYEMHSDWKKTKAFAQAAEKNPVTGVHIFLHKDFYAAVYCTNLLMHVCDFMVTKPSELSFYPIPKLFIQRVGRHEAWGAIRGSEIGDGTKEAEEHNILHRLLTMIIEEDDLLKMQVQNILNNDKMGIYNGGYNVVQAALRQK